MTDLVQKLVALISEAPHYFAPQHDFDGKKAEWFNAQRAALSEAKAGGWVAVPVQVLEDASEAIGHFVSDHGWGDSDMQAMDNLDAYIATHKARTAPPAQRGEG